MAMKQINPTRMELTRLKKRLVTARRGHKLLKDKRDEMMKQFLDIVRKNREHRINVEARLKEMYSSFLVASAVMSQEGMEQALMLPKAVTQVELSTKNVMSINVPVFDWVNSEETDIYSYGFFGTAIELDMAVDVLKDILPSLLELAQAEKSAQLLAAEIEKTRRRVNALEYVMIPELSDSIKYITMKLDENERGNLTRLMKVKDMMIEQARKAGDV